ncbi:winged helix-turn-helix domain-containing protein [Pseudomonas sp. O64]|uniref:winged helix-turn-helix domain-containing protein n=1 Tax=Pseudomonas TaxID=286 RepID=UPI000BA08921|nr:MULTISPECIES: winged helix-turn-helix domain-containing protein [unclassified Pseudomonas]MCV2226467.1 winged helix-turn-helix domain-containing protein [Pseudomonas sp. AU10]OZO05515.1 transcriptional regulator [Pseudomonas sp. IB20]UNM18532.1 winged helix-turn-helix domain-containing protein [Pseudomonas sp. ArH3a]UXZ21322.1 winged helix-turn-helix domain-containing protein [Pseudomonas sp. YeP6b]
MTLVNDGPTASRVFAGWTLYGDGRLTGEGVDTQLPPKEWHVLRLLLASDGVLMTKDRLLELGWPRGDVAEESLTRCIYALRKHLRKDKDFIKTIYGRGYRFTCAVKVEQHEPHQSERARAQYICSACGQVAHD